MTMFIFYMKSGEELCFSGDWVSFNDGIFGVIEGPCVNPVGAQQIVACVNASEVLYWKRLEKPQ